MTLSQQEKTDHQAIVDDLALIADQAHWAHTQALWPAGHGLDPERGVVHRPPTTAQILNPDLVLAGQHDLPGVDTRARDAYTAAAKALRYADLALGLAAHRHGVRAQPPLHEIDGTSRPDMLTRVAGFARWRLDHVPPGERQTLTNVRKHLDGVVRQLSVALDRGAADGQAHNEVPCKTCGIRPRAERETRLGRRRRASKGGECDVCATWRSRNRGTPRPVELDTGPVNAARAAQARRLARGDGWGAA